MDRRLKELGIGSFNVIEEYLLDLEQMTKQEPKHPSTERSKQQFFRHFPRHLHRVTRTHFLYVRTDRAPSASRQAADEHTSCADTSRHRNYWLVTVHIPQKAVQ